MMSKESKQKDIRHRMSILCIIYTGC